MKNGISILSILLVLLANSICGQTNLTLKKTIDSLFEIDQSIQLRIKGAIDNKVKFDSIQKLEQIEKQTFSQHIRIIKNIYSRHGYPTIKMVGRKSSTHYFTLIQHADSEPEFQSSMLPVFQTKDYPRGQVNGFGDNLDFEKPKRGTD